MATVLRPAGAEQIDNGDFYVFQSLNTSGIQDNMINGPERR